MIKLNLNVWGKNIGKNVVRRNKADKLDFIIFKPLMYCRHKTSGHTEKE